MCIEIRYNNLSKIYILKNLPMKCRQFCSGLSVLEMHIGYNCWIKGVTHMITRPVWLWSPLTNWGRHFADDIRKHIFFNGNFLISNVIGLCNGCSLQAINTLRPRQMDAISQTTFSNAFSWMKMFEFRLKFHWSMFPRVQLTIFQQWFR